MTRDLQLMLLIGDVVPRPVSAVLIDALHTARITSSSGSTSGFQLTFAVSARSELTRVMLPEGVLDPKKRVIVVAVVAGRSHVLIDGLITRQEMHPGRVAGSSFLTVTGEDLSLLMDLEHVERSYPGLPPHLRAMAVCAAYAQYGITPRAVAPALSDIPNPVVEIPVQSATDLAYLRAMAADVGHVFHIEPGPAPGVSTAYWGPQQRDGEPQPALTTGWGAADNVEELGFAFDGLSAARHTTRRVEPASRTVSAVSAPDPGLLHRRLAARPAAPVREHPLTGQTGRSLTQSLLSGLGRAVRSADAVTGHGTLDVLRYGQVLSARHLVGVRGAGPAYDGVYYVREVTHHITRERYQQDFSLVRDGLVTNTQVVTP
ncbi:hypothetical protein [Streptomyces sp. NPDC018833]|uniref:hypothetical protein n=1 Tax=Streptomyces sp. NPDC018833 TaxID=3365053 RepID=UPI003799CE2E